MDGPLSMLVRNWWNTHEFDGNFSDLESDFGNKPDNLYVSGPKSAAENEIRSHLPVKALSQK